MNDIAVVTLNDKGYADIGKLTAQVKQAYCKRHGYAFYHYQDLLDFDRIAPFAAWNKIPAILKHLKDYKWVFWIDADAVMIRPEIKLERFLDDRRDVLFGCDTDGLNSGVAFYQNTNRTWDFLTRAYAEPDWRDWPNNWEQRVFKLLIQRDWHCIRYSLLGDMINARPCQSADAFVLHAQGMHPKLRLATLEEYTAPVSYLPEREDLWLASYFRDAAARFLEIESVPMSGGSWKLARRGWDGYLNSTDGETEAAILSQYEGFNVISVSMNKPPADMRFDVVFWLNPTEERLTEWLPWLRGATVVAGVKGRDALRAAGFHKELHRSESFIFLQ